MKQPLRAHPNRPLRAHPNFGPIRIGAHRRAALQQSSLHARSAPALRPAYPNCEGRPLQGASWHKRDARFASALIKLFCCAASHTTPGALWPNTAPAGHHGTRDAATPRGGRPSVTGSVQTWHASCHGQTNQKNLGLFSQTTFYPVSNYASHQRQQHQESS